MLGKPLVRFREGWGSNRKREHPTYSTSDEWMPVGAAVHGAVVPPGRPRLSPFTREEMNVVIEVYEHLPAACLEYDPLAPQVARAVSDLILSKAAELQGCSGLGFEAPGRHDVISESAESGGNPERENSVDLTVEHIGSTSVPGCAGKGVIDLILLYSEGGLAHAKRVLDLLGFQRQQTLDPWPESRPMRLGGISHKGRQYRLHVHVISATSSEAAELRGFRDALRRDADLRQSYVDRKRAILAAGIVDSVDYSEAKGEFISGAIRQLIRSPGASA